MDGTLTMVSDRIRGINNLCLLSNLALVALVYWGWLQLYDGRIPLTDPQVKDYVLFLELLLLGLVLGFGSRRVRRDTLNPDWVRANNDALRQVAWALFSVFVAVTAFRLIVISRLFIFSFVPLLYATLLFGNRHLPGFIARRLFNGAREERIVLVGSPRNAMELRKWLDSKKLLGFRTLGIISDESAEYLDKDIPLLGGMEDLDRQLQDLGITQVILVEMPQRREVLRRCVEICEKKALRLLVVSDLEEQFRHSVRLFEDGGRRFVCLREEPLEDPLNRVLKRGLDLAVSLPVTLFVLPPVTLLVWILHRLQSPGPVLYSQMRAGIQNQPFRIIKFRTMHCLNSSESRQAAEHDERVFPAGRWLRKFSIDELPQFFNVLTGEMSVVGPRPHLSQHNDQFEKALLNFRLRATVKPGITGLAQIRGHRGEIKQDKDIADRVEADIHYLENWTLPLDCLIIFRTLGQVFIPPPSAY